MMMSMSKPFLGAAVVALIALPLFAAEGYSFHIKVTDAKTALLANPKQNEPNAPQMSPDFLERAAKNRVLLLDHTKGTEWSWLMLGWPKTQPTAEQFINVHGSAKADSGDIGMTPDPNGKMRLHCMRAECQIQVTVSGKQTSVTLKKDQSRALPLDADYDVTFPR
jgi:hypothetical protein